MAVTVTPLSSSTGVNRNVNTFIVTVTATADADTTATVTFPTPLPGGIAFQSSVNDTICIITNILQVPAALSLWAMTALGGTTATLTKATTAGSGNASPQIRAQFFRPHSMIR